MSAIFRGVFLTSEDPEATAEFYARVVSLPLEKIGSEGHYVYWRVDDGQMQLAIHDARMFAEYSHPARRESNLTHLYFKVADQAGFLRHLEGLDVVPRSIDEVVVTVADPDGRMVMFGTA